MIILIGLGAAATIAAGSYLLPLIITCIASGITIIVTFVSTRAYYQSKNDKSEELHELKKEQILRDNKLRDEVSRIATETGLDMQQLLQLSKEQQLVLKNCLSEFTKNIEESDAATKNINEIAGSLEIIAKNSNLQNAVVFNELNKIKNELVLVNNKLKEAESTIIQKDSELQVTLDKLKALEEKFTKDSEINQNNMQKLTDEISKTNKSLEMVEAGLISKDAEIASLREKNLSLSANIISLKNTISSLNTKVSQYTEKDDAKIQEIQLLINENKQLSDTIQELVETIESKNTSRSANNKPVEIRLFQPRKSS
ncbi:MAG: hypothetical protein A3E88_07310 [Legionellales bacterium RIFCSPHIGHO2_12_FULL_35_11]|nr:MAG: hypothetical protein A3E88_07310 [Legionellales bacterium RIFCSPHIGHO2_12_FULL_35_11]